MKTRYTTSAAIAARMLKRGGLVAFPTETVYGLGAVAFDARAISAIFQAKGRPGDNPLIVHVATRTDVRNVAREVPLVARRFMKTFWPGPLTLVLPRHPDVPDRATAGLDTVGVRQPRHPLARAFLRAVGAPVAAPSANRSGRPSPTTWQAVREDLDGRIACVLQGGRSPVGLESTVVDCTGKVPIVLRAGSVSLEALRTIEPRTRMATVRDRTRGRSPGLKHRHYAPHARVVLSAQPPRAGISRAGWIGIGAPPGSFAYARSCRSVAAYAREVFHFFRECEARGIQTIYCAPISGRGIGAALMDRLRRAASATR